MPVTFIPDQELGLAETDTAGLVGPSTVLAIPGVIFEGGSGRENLIGADLQVRVVDLDASVAVQLRVAGEVEEDPFAFPAAQPLLQAAHAWLAQHVPT